jgi:thymidylate synthase ThyX
MTHRVFSKNSASSRAIPYEKMRDSIFDNIVKPIWTENKKGMQGDVIEHYATKKIADSIWAEALGEVTFHANKLNELGIHKQNVNRMLEPWTHIRIILTGTDFSNWYELRNHKDAQPEIQELAKCMLYAISQSKPKYLEPGQWHLPFGDNIEFEDVYPFDGETNKLNNANRLKISTARCARISYNNVDGSASTIAKDIALFDKLIVSKPLHASPAEHQGRVPTGKELEYGYLDSGWYNHKDRFGDDNWEFERGKYVSNLTGWIQYRKLIENGE